MKKYQFNLASVLKVRRHQEDMQKQAFGKVIQKREEIQQKINKVNEQLQQHHTQESVGVAAIRNHYAFLQDSHKMLHKFEFDLKRADREVDKERAKLVQSNQKTRILENLESKQRLWFLKELDKEEEKLMNEIATQRFNRDRR